MNDERYSAIRDITLLSHSLETSRLDTNDIAVNYIGSKEVQKPIVPPLAC